MHKGKAKILCRIILNPSNLKKMRNEKKELYKYIIFKLQVEHSVARYIKFYKMQKVISDTSKEF